MRIYPKTSNDLEGIKVLKPFIEKYKGTEIQMMRWEELEYIDEVIQNIMEEIPSIEEITVHPPLKEDYNFEVLTYRNYETEERRIQRLVNISKKYSIKINLLYHVKWNYSCLKTSGLINELERLLKNIENTNVSIVLENLYSIVDKKDCAVMQLVKELNNKHLGICLDICHMHCEANMFKQDIDEFIQGYLEANDCEKYVYQIHFSGTLDNDGYVNPKKTHGRKHDSIEEFKKDYEILKKLKIEDKIIVTEVAEEDYNIRCDQIEEIEMLEGISK